MSGGISQALVDWSCGVISLEEWFSHCIASFLKLRLIIEILQMIPVLLHTVAQFVEDIWKDSPFPCEQLLGILYTCVPYANDARNQKEAATFEDIEAERACLSVEILGVTRSLCAMRRCPRVRLRACGKYHSLL